MLDRQDIEQTISAIIAHRQVLGETVVETSLAALRQQLADQTERPVNPADLSGERKQVTVMFADISGFTAMSEKLDPRKCAV